MRATGVCADTAGVTLRAHIVTTMRPAGRYSSGKSATGRTPRLASATRAGRCDTGSIVLAALMPSRSAASSEIVSGHD